MTASSFSDANWDAQKSALGQVVGMRQQRHWFCEVQLHLSPANLQMLHTNVFVLAHAVLSLQQTNAATPRLFVSKRSEDFEKLSQGFAKPSEGFKS